MIFAHGVGGMIGTPSIVALGLHLSEMARARLPVSPVLFLLLVSYGWVNLEPTPRVEKITFSRGRVCLSMSPLGPVGAKELRDLG